MPRAAEAIERCRVLARMSEEPGRTTRTWLSPPVRDVHRTLREWMEPLGMRVHVDAAGNLRGVYPGQSARRLLIGSHTDTVPGAGAFDGVLGVVLAIALVEELAGRRLPFAIEIAAFSDEEGVRFGVPFLGSRALAGTFDGELLALVDSNGVTAAEAMRAFGLDPARLPEAVVDPGVFAYLEFHIEQGPVLESLGRPLAVVEAIVGQSRVALRFHGQPNHAGTTPMHLRRDALAAAAEWVSAVEGQAAATPGLVATVGRMEVRPGADNVIPGEVDASLDVRHEHDETRLRAVSALIAAAHAAGARRSVSCECSRLLDQPAVRCDARLSAAFGAGLHRMTSGAGHDAMILASRVPVAMLFLRSPGGISHHPGEAVLPEDVQAALDAGTRFLDAIA